MRERYQLVAVRGGGESGRAVAGDRDLPGRVEPYGVSPAPVSSDSSEDEQSAADQRGEDPLVRDGSGGRRVGGAHRDSAARALDDELLLLSRVRSDVHRIVRPSRRNGKISAERCIEVIEVDE
ncbi:hypothetical protein [Streptomyces scopuliridis]|uniref:hypothetical protein n=1 Tax=Streptomyces scopuliridis TaxID=452529 RepID=UPI00367FF6EB